MVLYSWIVFVGESMKLLFRGLIVVLFGGRWSLGYNVCMKHEMGLQSKYFDYIRNGTKRIELRLFDEKRQRVRLGDIIEFTNPDGEKLLAKVVGLLRYGSFEDLFRDFDISILADVSMTKRELLDVLNGFYPAEKQAEMGVVGIRVEVTYGVIDVEGLFG